MSDCVPCDEMALAPAAPPAQTRVGWEGVIGMEGEMTGDARLIEPGALRWDSLPLPLRYVGEDVGGHDGAAVVGTIDTIERGSGGQILATGTLDSASEAGLEAIRQVGEGLTTGVSMDLDDVSFEVRVASELLDEGEAVPMPGEEGGAAGLGAADAEGRVTVVRVNSDDEVRVTTSGRIRAATIVAIPAFAEARIGLTGESDSAQAPVEEPADEAVVASAVPTAPPAEWFADPRLDGPSPLRVTDEGRVYGHLAAWHTCHTGHAGSCVMAPRSTTGYAYFTTGTLVSAEGAEIAVGRITLDTRHAGGRLSAASAISHYEDTGAVVADVCAGEDAHGIWVAGALRPGVTAEQVRSLRAAPLSGDWRRIGGNLELVAALAVNVPGFPIPRPSGLVAGGTMQTLVASGMVPPRKVARPGTPNALSVDDLRYLKRLADRERAEEQRAALADLSATEQVAAKVRAFALKRKVERSKAALAAGGQ